MKKPIALPPGFWNEYTTPATEVQRALQYPTCQPELFINRLMTAYQRDCGVLKKKETS